MNEYEDIGHLQQASSRIGNGPNKTHSYLLLRDRNSKELIPASRHIGSCWILVRRERLRASPTVPVLLGGFLNLLGNGADGIQSCRLQNPDITIISPVIPN